ncbi:MAG TPA: glycosyltransferase family 2 protein [Bacillota bacterium]|nr:glycosyltransferase family 2 protein [Bacillota bacterium]
MFYTLINILSFTCWAVAGVATLYLPLAFIFELRRPKVPVFINAIPLVSVIVPAYNEAKVVSRCIESILCSDYPVLELILVDDGSTDETFQILKRYTRYPNVKAIGKSNGGKASALNFGLKLAQGEIIFLIDADGVFHQTTIWEMLKGFDHPEVGGVCGSDTPINLENPQTKFCKIQTHVTTGIARRALALMNCLPIISGNIGAFRRTALEKTGPLREDIIGEDLELTWRLHRLGYRVNFQPTAVVTCEVPATVNNLWKQRVRWARGFLQTVAIHWRMFFNFKRVLLSSFLLVNCLNMVCIPVFQLLIIIVAPLTLLLLDNHFLIVCSAIIGMFGAGLSFFICLVGILMEKAWRDLRYLYLVPLWVIYSLFIDFTMVWAIILQIRKVRATWDKFERTGVATKLQSQR